MTKMDFARTELIVEDAIGSGGAESTTGIVPTRATLLVDGREVAMSSFHPITVETNFDVFTTATVTILIDKVTMHQVKEL